MSVKKSIIQRHLLSTKHTIGKKKIQDKEMRESDIAGTLKSFDKEVHPVGETLPEEVRVYSCNSFLEGRCSLG